MFGAEVCRAKVGRAFAFSMEHDLFGKPASTFGSSHEDGKLWGMLFRIMR
jgi:hypothetical protein